MGNSQTPSYTPYKVTSSEILWVGGDIDCLGICNGVRLTELELAIANKVCELQDSIDGSTLVLPECLVVAWQTRNKTVLEFIKFLLDSYCTQQEINTQLQNELTNVNPQITLTYCCCNEQDGCNTNVTLTLSAHLQKILNCLCEQSSRIDELENIIGNASLLPPNTSVIDLLLQVKATATTANTNAANWVVNKTNIQSATEFPIILT